MIANNESDFLPFFVNNETAQIRVANWLDYEEIKAYNFIVKAEVIIFVNILLYSF